jgi:hypothetical protein
LSYWHKLWDKGVDIGAGIVINTISAGIIALIATLAWRWKRKRDLKHEEDKQRQQHRIAEEFAREQHSKANVERRLGLERELESLVAKIANAGSVGNGEHLQIAWNGWRAWLTKNELQYLPRNQEILDSWINYSDKFSAASSNRNVSLWAERLASQLRKTQLSPD